MEKTQAIILSQASLLLNFATETVLRIRAMIREDRIEYIITKLNEMCNEEGIAICAISDIYFKVPNGNMVLRRCEQYNEGSLIFYKRVSNQSQSGLNLPGSIDSYECAHFELDLAYAFMCVLIQSLNIEKQVGRRVHSYLLPDCTHIVIEPSPIDYYSVYMQVILKSTRQNMDKNYNDAIETIKNLMQELSITEDDLII